MDASPKAISGRTSYSQARLAFHFLPQLIPEYCTAHGFRPPPAFLRDSPWSWQARLASGPPPSLNFALLTLDFSSPPGQNPLDKERARTRWLVLQKARRHPAISGAPTLCKQMVSGSISPPSPGYFSPFPHGTNSLSVSG